MKNISSNLKHNLDNNNKSVLTEENNYLKNTEQISNNFSLTSNNFKEECISKEKYSQLYSDVNNYSEKFENEKRKIALNRSNEYKLFLINKIKSNDEFIKNHVINLNNEEYIHNSKKILKELGAIGKNTNSKNILLNNNKLDKTKENNPLLLYKGIAFLSKQNSIIRCKNLNISKSNNSKNKSNNYNNNSIVSINNSSNCYNNKPINALCNFVRKSSLEKNKESNNLNVVKTCSNLKDKIIKKSITNTKV